MSASQIFCLQVPLDNFRFMDTPLPPEKNACSKIEGKNYQVSSKLFNQKKLNSKLGG